MGVQHRASAILLPGKTRYPLYTRVGGPRGRFGRGENSRLGPGFNPRAVHPVTTRSTEYAFAAAGINVGVWN